MRAQSDKINEQYKAKANKNRIHLSSNWKICMATLEEGKVPFKKKSKLMIRGDDPYKIVRKVKDNACKIEFSGEMNISATFNVENLILCIKDEDLRANSLRGRWIWSK